jgi:tripartite-type tricarboxylate transporter receptor subunit TctC
MSLRERNRIWKGFFGSVALALLWAFGGISTTHAQQDYPAKPVRILVPVSPGGPMDMIARIVSEKLNKKWGRAFVVENRPGAGQVIATNAAAKSPPDGYTLLLMGHSFTMNPWLFKSMPYKNEDLSAVTQLTQTPLILVVNPNLPIHSVRELIDYAKAHPGKLSFGSSGPSSSLRFAGELLKYMTGIEMTHVAYSGNGPMSLAIMSNEVHLGFVNPVSLPSIREGRLRALAITSKRRSANLPDLPTVAESGVPGYEAGSWFGLMVPSQTPKEIVGKLNVAVNEVLQMPDVKKLLMSVDAQPSGNSANEFSAYIASELVKWRDLIKKTGITIK